MSVYVASMLGRERRRLQLVLDHVAAEPELPDSITAEVQGALDCLRDAELSVLRNLDRQHSRGSATTEAVLDVLLIVLVVAMGLLLLFVWWGR